MSSFVMNRSFCFAETIFTAAIIFLSIFKIKAKANDNPNEWIEIEEAITKDYFKHFKYKHFSNIQEIGFRKV